jgi:hypothetical protein
LSRPFNSARRASKGNDLGLRNVLLQATAQRLRHHAPATEQGRQRLGGHAIEAIDHRQRLRQMLVETLAKHRVVEHEVLPGAAFDIDRALTQFLDGGGQLIACSLLRRL